MCALVSGRWSLVTGQKQWNQCSFITKCVHWLLCFQWSKVKYWKVHIEALPSCRPFSLADAMSGNSIQGRVTQNRVCATEVEWNFCILPNNALQCVFKQWKQGVAEDASSRSCWVVNLVYSPARSAFSTRGPFYSNLAPASPPVKQRC